MRHITDTLIYLNEKQAREFLGDHTEPSDVEFFDGMHASAHWAEGHEGLYIILIGDEN
jgi:hypothetical protein